jgi:hypothetical protein
METRSPLFHSSNDGKIIAAKGLQTFVTETCVYHDYLNHPYPKIQDQATQHKGAFVFASDREFESQLYAFKPRIDRDDPADFGKGLYMVGMEPVRRGDPKSDLVGVIVVGNAKEWQAVSADKSPVCFKILPTYAGNFENVKRPDGMPTSEWVSRSAVPPNGLSAEPLALGHFAGRLEVFESANGKGPSRGRWFELLERGEIRPANHLVGLPPTGLILPSAEVIQTNSGIQPAIPAPRRTPPINRQNTFG